VARCLPWLVCLLLLGAPAAAQAQGTPVFTGFHSVLAFGEGEGTTAADLAAYEANGTPPPADVNQLQQYEGLEQAWPGFTAADLNKYFKNSDFAPEPSTTQLATLLAQGNGGDPGRPQNVETPEQGVTIVRQPPYYVPRIYASTRAEGMWAAGYATAEDRLFFMDVLRHTAEGTMSELLGASSAPADSAQLGIQDATPQHLTAELQSLPKTNGAEGAQALSDLQNYVAGINAFINLTKIDPARMPAEYPALGVTPQTWTLADTAAVGIYLVGQFTVFGGDQGQQAEALRMARKRLGAKQGTKVWSDLRLAGDPGAAVTLSRRFYSDRTGKVNPRSEAMIDPGSLVKRNAVTGGPGGASDSAAVAATSARDASRLPPWARALATRGLHLPHLESNAVLVDAKRSGTGQALAVMGPQVGYYTPEVFLEYELHAPGIDVSGVSFPGASPYPLIGHGIDFAWTGTSAYSANEDVFAEKLCNPNHSRPSFASSHYVYKGRCIAFSSGEIVEHTPVAPTSPSPPQTITMHTLNSVHGPITSYARVHGAPVALATAAATLDHEAPAYVAFMRLAENQPTSPQSFIAAMRAYPGSENWFYVDDKNIAVYQSGLFPEHARGTNPDFPIWGTGRWDWRGFTPADHGYRALPASANPQSIDPSQGYLVNWNNALAHGWRVAAGDWENGPVVRATILQDLLRSALRQGPLTLTGLTGMVTAPSLTADLRGMAVWPWLRRVIGHSRSAGVRRLVGVLQAWSRAGSQRRSLTYGGEVSDSPAVLLMDAWWPRLVRAEFQPVVGRSLMNFINHYFNQIQPDGIRDGTGNGFFEGWEMDVQNDLRQVLHRHVRGHFSRTYCGQGSLRRCRKLLTRTLLQAAAALKKRYGASMTNWKLPTLCPVSSPPGCDQIEPTAAGAVNLPPQPFDNRGTFYQAVAVGGHRP
jgi:acyl-homoserine lactone acylase PvdQ